MLPFQDPCLRWSNIFMRLPCTLLGALSPFAFFRIKRGMEKRSFPRLQQSRIARDLRRLAQPSAPVPIELLPSPRDSARLLNRSMRATHMPDTVPRSFQCSRNLRTGKPALTAYVALRKVSPARLEHAAFHAAFIGPPFSPLISIGAHLTDDRP